MYVLFPTDGLPRVVDAELSDGRISDDLGGTFIDSSLSATTAIVLRDDVAGLPFNPAATLLVSITVGHSVPMYGPVILAALDAIAEAVNPAGEHGYIGALGSLPSNVANAAVGVGTPGLLVYGGRAEGVDPVFVEGIRGLFRAATAVTVPAGWPGASGLRLDCKPLDGPIGQMQAAAVERVKRRHEWLDETIIDGPFII